MIRFMFLPTTKSYALKRGWKTLDVILVTGDAYIDSPFIGVAMIARVLEARGFKVGVIAQPRTDCPDDITRLGEPDLFWGVTGGCVDSMIANYTATKKFRKTDDYTPGGKNSLRPDRAVIAFTNLIRRHFKNTSPIVLGGIEASLRRIAHYDFWSNSIRRSVLFDAKADYLLYGMAHASILELANTLKNRQTPDNIKGLAYISKKPSGKEIPSFEAVKKDKKKYIESFHTFYANNDPKTAVQICQQHNDRYLIQNPPADCSTTEELDWIHSLPFERDLHPYYKNSGTVRALDTIRFAIPIHYGCYGECHFCAITVHQGRTVQWRSKTSIIKEARAISKLKGFKGIILDLGGPTANMYGFECEKKLHKGACKDRRCLFPSACKNLKPDHSKHLELIRELERLPFIKKVFISSGIRPDLLLHDTANQKAYLKKIVSDNVSGQMKIAPEHTSEHVLSLMGKPGIGNITEFKKQFDAISKKAGKKQFLTYYLMAAHPGCTAQDMKDLKTFASRQLNIQPEQVQIFTPSPSTYSTLMYYTGLDPFSLQPVTVERSIRGKEQQKSIITRKQGKRGKKPRKRQSR